ncbi:MAG TPA: hypothetical protein VHT91_49410 [Kofleriaceae bacterium]|jgi:hypothetical protein|nr:hypothetical protein [Kofleriaceae bacterium]
MQTLPTISILSLGVLGLVACATTPSSAPPDPTGDTDIEIRHTGAAVTGSSFQCTGTWPSALTPCGYSWSSQPQTLAISEGSAKLRLVLRRSPMPVDGGASTVFIDLMFDATGTPTAAAQESTTRAPLGTGIETSKPISGWIDPIAMSAAADARQAGTFSLTFEWGTISGTYDTAPAP